jgi:feruloyl esterase
MYTGWADMAVSPLGTIEYYESVLKKDARAAEDVRLFMLPGVEHCHGGAGPDVIDVLDEIDQWVEGGKAPDRLIAYWKDDPSAGGRPVCAYPRVATYNGEGDPRDPASFTCEPR